jgi:hypothetical protein
MIYRSYRGGGDSRGLISDSGGTGSSFPADEITFCGRDRDGAIHHPMQRKGPINQVVICRSIHEVRFQPAIRPPPP